MRRWLVMPMLLAMLLAAGCGADRPVEVSRKALGTVVSITAYGDDEEAVTSAIDGAYAAMAAVEAQLDAHDQSSAISQFNAQPYQAVALSAETSQVLDAIAALRVSAEFSPSLLGVTRLYAFEEGGRVPDPAALALSLAASKAFSRTGDGGGAFARVDPDVRLEAGGELVPGLDLGGAAKGLALDRARDALKASGAVTAAIISAGSSTVTFGTKPDGSAWRIGIEDPRDAEEVVATFAFEADGALSTSGDYQRAFEANGRRYHHILHPATGRPAEGVRSLTVAGTSLSGLHSDILSTALFVRGADEAEDYAADIGLALYVVDAEGRTLVVPAPEGSGLSLAEKAMPKP
ncbi:MAG: FAD:protein FMN transferase [Coriobacteriia bacterium]